MWKIAHGAHDLLSDPLDPDVARLRTMVHDIRAEEHDMHAFVRFRRVERGGTEHWLAWYAPTHHVLDRVAEYFTKRYPDTPWTIITPDRAASWDTHRLTFGPGAGPDVEPAPDELDALFDTYFAGESRADPRCRRACRQAHRTARVKMEAEMRSDLAQTRAALERLCEGERCNAVVTMARSAAPRRALAY